MSQAEIRFDPNPFYANNARFSWNPFKGRKICLNLVSNYVDKKLSHHAFTIRIQYIFKKSDERELKRHFRDEKKRTNFWKKCGRHSGFGHTFTLTRLHNLKKSYGEKMQRATLTKAKEINRSKQYITLHTRLRSPFNVYWDLRLTIAYQNAQASTKIHAHTRHTFDIHSSVWYFPIGINFSLDVFLLLLPLLHLFCM